MNWSNDVFLDCYNSIQYRSQQAFDAAALNGIKNDLKDALVTPPKQEASKQKLIDNKSLIEFSNGDKYKLNDQFVENAILLSNELDFNELAATELLYYANDPDSNSNFIGGISFIDQGRQTFFRRYEYILNILGYLITEKQLDSVVQDFKAFGDKIIESFSKIYKILANLEDLFTKQTMTSTVDESFLSTAKYTREQLLNCHELLGQISFNLVEKYPQHFQNFNFYTNLITHISANVDDNDLLLLHYLPTLLNIVSSLSSQSSQEISSFHKQAVTKLSNDYKLVTVNEDLLDLSNSKLKNFEVLLTFVFLTNMIPWCKQGGNTDKFHFNDDILSYIQICSNYGVFENLLRFTNETAHESTKQKFELNHLCDFRSLIQITFPNLSHVKFHSFSNNPNTRVAATYTDNLPISAVFKDELIPYYWHVFFINFISHAAIVLTELRDSEEDYLLSSINKHQKSIKNRNNEDTKDIQGLGNASKSDDLASGSVSVNESDLQLNYDEIYARADLERFYLSFVYTYTERSQLCSLIWNDEEIKNEMIGFINWGVVNNSSPLITATFCLLLSSLTCKDNLVSTIKIWEILINNNSSFKKTDYSKISMDSIIDSLYYYLNSLNENFENDLNNHLSQKNKRPDLLFSHSSAGNSVSNRILIELSEDSTIFITGFSLLISSLVENLNDDSERSVEICQNLFNRFKPIIIGFLRFDNIVVNSQLGAKTNELPVVSINELNRSTLVNLMLHLLNSFVDTNAYEPRYEIWEIVDKWMNHQLLDETRSSQSAVSSTSASKGGITPIGLSMVGPFTSTSALATSSAAANDKQKLVKHPVNMKSAFGMNLVNSSNVMNFITLIKRLLTSPENATNFQLSLLYPTNLGYGYRSNNQIGVWPYIEFVISEILSNSNKIPDSTTKLMLQNEIVTLLLTSLQEIDWKFLIEVLPNVSSNPVNYSKFFSGGLTLDLFIKLHHSISVLNYLYDEKSYKLVFEIISKEEDDALVWKSLKLLQKMLDLQDVFNYAVKSLKDETKVSGSSTASERPTSIFQAFNRANSSNSLIASASTGLASLSIYYPNHFNTIKLIDIISFHIPLIIQLGLLVNSSNDETVRICLNLLKKVNQKYYETKEDDNLLIKNKLLTLFANNAESNELKFSFINQFINGDITIKQEILKFLIHDLTRSNGNPCVTHFILGYEIKGNYLVLPENREEFINNLGYYLMISLSSISVVDYNNGVSIIEANSTKLAALILEIFNHLCSIPISSSITLNLLRNYVVEEENLFERLIKYYTKIDADTIWSEFKFDGDLINDTNQFVEHEQSVLTFFNFCKLRDLIIKYLTIEFHSLSQSGSIYKKNHYLELLINGDKFLNESHKILSFLDLLNFKLQSFEKFNFQKYQNLNLNLIYEELRPKESGQRTGQTKVYGLNHYDDHIIHEKVIDKLQRVGEFDSAQLLEVKTYLKKFFISDKLDSLQFEYLHSWVQLIEVIINDGNLSKDKNQNFILEILSSILPKINESFDQNTKFCEELISLCVILFDYYEDDNLFIERLIYLFSTCYKGVINTNSTIELRNDLYIIMNIFLQKSFKASGEKLLNKVIEILKEIDLRFLEILCNDSIVNEGSIRITSIILLESIIHLFNKFNNQFIISNLTKNNWLLLIIRSIKRIDEIFDDNVKDISFILYELINFKSVINLLIRVGQVRVGSSYLIQSELFSILKQLNFSNIDPDLGFNLRINELSKQNLSINSNLSFVNYYEFLLPIFKLISILLISMGPNYKPSKIQGKNLMDHFGKLRDSIIKKDILTNENKVEYQFEKELTELINQFILIDSLIQD